MLFRSAEVFKITNYKYFRFLPCPFLIKRYASICFNCFHSVLGLFFCLFSYSFLIQTILLQFYRIPIFTMSGVPCVATVSNKGDDHAYDRQSKSNICGCTVGKTWPFSRIPPYSLPPSGSHSPVQTNAVYVNGFLIDSCHPPGIPLKPNLVSFADVVLVLNWWQHPKQKGFIGCCTANGFYTRISKRCLRCLHYLQ